MCSFRQMFYKNQNGNYLLLLALTLVVFFLSIYLIPLPMQLNPFSQMVCKELYVTMINLQ